MNVVKMMFLDALATRSKEGKENVVLRLASYDDPDKLYNLEISARDAEEALSEIRDCIVTLETN